MKTAKKAEEAAGKDVKKAAAKKDVKETVSLQYLGKDIKVDEIIGQIRKVWTGKLKKKAADLNTINVYLKPEDNAAYYVINDSAYMDKIDL